MSSPVTGGVRFSLLQPTKNGCDPTDAGCENAFVPVTSLAYCSQSAEQYKGNKWPCEYYENNGAGVVMSNGLLVVTRQTTSEEMLVCTAANGTTCPHVFNATSRNTTYVADIEAYTVLVDHSVTAAALLKSVTKPSSTLRGRLNVKQSHSLCKEYHGYVDLVGTKRTRKAPCYIKPNETSRNLDFFSLDVSPSYTSTPTRPFVSKI